jgi:Tol biopolymer transport system component
VPTWTMDDSEILFFSNRGGREQLYAMPAAAEARGRSVPRPATRMPPPSPGTEGEWPSSLTTKAPVTST